MPKKELRDALDTLHTELSSAEGLDTDTRSRLAAAMREIAEKLEGTAAEAPASHSLGDSIREAVERFEGEHPELVNAVGRVAEALGAAGI